MLKIQNYTKKFGSKVAVDNLSLHIQKGEIYGFIGPNGAGKTTTIKAICGLTAVEEGDVFIDNISIKTNPVDCKRKIAFIPDNPDLYEYLSGIKYLNFIADVFSVPKDKREKIISDLATKFEIKSDLAQPISAYSHGMKQKLAIISAWLHEPSVIVMDEPFVGLDPKASHILKSMMREFCNNGGAIFFSTHVLDVAEKICDKMAIIMHGKLVVSGTMDEVRGDSSLEKVFLELVDQPNISTTNNVVEAK